jgi:hypothetical protein
MEGSNKNDRTLCMLCFRPLRYILVEVFTSLIENRHKKRSVKVIVDNGTRSLTPINPQPVLLL